MKPNCLLLEYISSEALAILEKHTHVIKAKTPASGMEIATEMPIDVIVTRGSGQVDEQLMNHCQGLKMIARCGVGLDNVDIAHASELGIKVINAPGSNADTVAEHTLALLLAAKRQIPMYAKAAKANNWMNRSQYDGDEIRGKTLGILGLGNIGSKVAQLATAFGMTVQYWNRTPKETPYLSVTFETLISTSDIISIHLPQVKATHHLINAPAFQKMKSTAFIINTARGTIIEELALIEALKNQRIAGFAADVLYQEPPIDNHPLFQFPNVLITPHTASLTALTFNEMCVITANNLVDFLAGKDIEERFIFNRAAF